MQSCNRTHLNTIYRHIVSNIGQYIGQHTSDNIHQTTYIRQYTSDNIHQTTFIRPYTSDHIHDTICMLGKQRTNKLTYIIQYS